MAFPAEPANGSTSWQSWADAIHTTAQQVFDVKAAYGAKGDGTTDDTAALQAAITDAAAVGGTVFLPRGTYIITSALTVSAPIVMRGGGWWASIIRVSGSLATALTTGALIITHTSAGGVYEDIQIDANAKAAYAVYWNLAGENLVNTRFHRVKMRGGTTTQGYFYNTGGLHFQECTSDGTVTASVTTNPNQLAIFCPSSSLTIVGGEWFGQVKVSATRFLVTGAVIGPIFYDNAGARVDWQWEFGGCYLIDGGTNNVFSTSTNLTNTHVHGCYIKQQVNSNVANGNMPASCTFRYTECMVQQFSTMNSTTGYLLQASGAGRLVIDGGRVALVTSPTQGVLHGFNPVASATTTTSTVLAMTGLT